MRTRFLIALLVLGCPMICFADASMYACKTDADCIAVQEWCCSCNNGGRNTSINKNSKQEYSAMVGKKCSAVSCAATISEHQSCHALPVCVDNKCTLKIDHPYWNK